MPPPPRSWSAVTIVALLSGAVGCTSERASVFRDHSDAGASLDRVDGAPLPPLQDAVDILFVIDDSGSMGQEQGHVTSSFGKLLAALASSRSGGRLPDLHVGVVSTDLGVGAYSIPSCERPGGDEGKLQARPRKAGCSGPKDAYLAQVDGKTNIPGCTGDPATCLDKAFSCVAALGTGGCGFEAPLESARRALDAKLRRNPGFLRAGALLAVVFVSDEDDCSARDAQLFDGSTATTAKLGPLSSFRCFEYGIHCDGDTSTAKERMAGKRSNCHPAGDWLYPVDDYVEFFTQLKRSRSRVLMSAIAGPASPILVGKTGDGKPYLSASCQTSEGFAVPALRLGAVVAAFGGSVSSICGPKPLSGASPDFDPPLAALGKRIAARLPGK